MLLDPRKVLADKGFPRETVLPLVVAYIFESRRVARQEFVAKRDPKETQRILRDALAAVGFSDPSTGLGNYESESKYQNSATVNKSADEEFRDQEIKLFGIEKGFDQWHRYSTIRKRNFELRARFQLLYTLEEQIAILEATKASHDPLVARLAEDKREHPSGSGPLAIPHVVTRFCAPKVAPDVQYAVLVDADNYGIHREIDELLAKRGTIVGQMGDDEMEHFAEGDMGAWRRAMDLIIAKFVGDLLQQQHAVASDCEMLREQLRVALEHNQASEAEAKAAKAIAEQLKDARKDLEMRLEVAETLASTVQEEHKALTTAIEALGGEKKELEQAIKTERTENAKLKARLAVERKENDEDELRKRLEEARLENDRIQREALEQKRQLGLKMVELIDLRKQEENDKEEIAQLKKQLLDIPKPEPVNEEYYTTTIDDLTRQVGDLQEQLKAAHEEGKINAAQIAGDLIAQVQELEAVQEDARKLHTQLQAEKKELEDDCRRQIDKCREASLAHKDAVKHLTEENKMLRGQVDALRASTVPLPSPEEGDEFAEANVEMEKLQAAMQELTDEKNEIANREKELRAELATARNAVGDIDRLKADLHAVQAEKRELANREAAATAKIEELTAATANATAAATNALQLQAQLDELQAAKTELEAQLVDTKTTSASELRALREELGKQNTLIREQKMKIARFDKRPSPGDAMPAVGQDVLEKVVAEVLDTLAKFDQILDNADWEEVPAKMKGLAASLRNSAKKLKNTFGDESGHQAHVKELQAAISAGKLRIEELEANSKFLQEQIDLCDARVESVKIEREGYITVLLRKLEDAERRAMLSPATVPSPPGNLVGRLTRLSGQLREDAAALRMISLRLSH